MRAITRAAMAAFAVMLASASFAGTKVLGVEIGVSTEDQVRQALSKTTQITELGSNAYSDGNMFSTSGEPYDIQGLKKVSYVFDQQRRLTAVFLNLGNDRFNSVFAALAGKYKLISKQVPHVGDRSAHFSSSDCAIEIDSPHMSFNLTVSYSSFEFRKAYDVRSKAAAEAKKKSEASKF